MYLVITDKTPTLKILNGHVKYLQHTRIYWQRYVNNKKLTQCHRCQEWRHATSNCRAIPACLKCGEEHLTKDCQYPQDREPKCVNCGNAHPANSTRCPVYLSLLKAGQEGGYGQGELSDLQIR